MDEQKVRNYLLVAVIPDKGQSYDKHLRSLSKMLAAMTVVFLGAAFSVGVLLEYANIITNVFVALLSLSIPINAILSFRLVKRTVANWIIIDNEATDSKTHNSGEINKSKPYAVIGSIIGSGCGIIGMFIANIFLSDISQRTGITIVLSIFSPLIIFFTYGCTASYYNLYLLKKYCPDLIGYKRESAS